MGAYKFAAPEFCFPVWGSLAMEMAKEAGFDGIEITDGGGYLQPHPDNNGFVEYERLGLDLTRQDSFPLTDPFVQDYYMSSAEKAGIPIMGIYLYLLENQGFIKSASDSVQGKHCLETIRNAVSAAAEMKIPYVTLPVKGLFGTFQHEYAFEKIEYAAKEAKEKGVELLIACDACLERQKEISDRTGGSVKLAFNTIDPIASASGNPPEMIRELASDYIGQIRVKDLKADEDGFVTRETGVYALLGTGDGMFYESAEAVRETVRCRWIVSETPYYSGVFKPAGDDFVKAAALDVKTMRAAFNGR